MRRVLLTAAVGAALLLSADQALACSCVQLDAESKLKAAKAAFIGRVVKKTLVEGDGRPFGSTYRYRLRVGRAYKRKLTEHIAIRASNDDGTCGFEWDVGEKVAAYLYGRRGNWNTSLCLLERPRRLRRAARSAGISRRSPPRSPLSTCR